MQAYATYYIYYITIHVLELYINYLCYEGYSFLYLCCCCPFHCHTANTFPFFPILVPFLGSISIAHLARWNTFGSCVFGVVLSVFSLGLVLVVWLNKVREHGAYFLVKRLQIFLRCSPTYFRSLRETGCCGGGRCCGGGFCGDASGPRSRCADPPPAAVLPGHVLLEAGMPVQDMSSWRQVCPSRTSVSPFSYLCYVPLPFFSFGIKWKIHCFGHLAKNCVKTEAHQIPFRTSFSLPHSLYPSIYSLSTCRATAGQRERVRVRLRI